MYNIIMNNDNNNIDQYNINIHFFSKQKDRTNIIVLRNQKKLII